jgi:hypothetical protein
LYAAAQGQIAGGWIVTPDATAAGGARLQNADAGAPKLPQPLAAPALSFDLTFTADAGRAYRLWLRGRALNDRYTNDSVFVQFDNSVNASGAPVWRIGSISATTVVLEDCSGCGLQGWGWADNGYGSAGPLVYFARSGPQRMRIQVREDGIAIDQVVLSAAKFLVNAPGVPKNDATILLDGSVQPRPSVKLAFWNIKAGVGRVGLAGHPVLFASNSNCTDPTKPLNAWGVGMVQAALIQALGNDPNVVALGLAEAWSSMCASAEKIRQLLGWKAKGDIQNGLTIVARYGFAGPQEWQQLDTSLNANPADTMWVVRAPVCVDAACTRSLVVYVAHWMNTNPDKLSDESTNRQAQQTVSFMQQTSGGRPHVLIGDLNVPEGPAYVCGQRPDNTSLNYLRAAGYIDAWPTVHGTAEGYTGMTNRVGCGIPEGYAWKRIDDAWSPPSYRPLDMQRFAMVPGGDASPSDHYGIIVTYPDPATR